jgi:NADPH-dependent 2,4-dienoyl-CoA reductase/sulfur reductase-like enzyme
MVEGLSDNCWNQGGQSTEHAALSRDLETDVCIVGAGIAGLTTAYRLAVAGMDKEDKVQSVTSV